MKSAVVALGLAAATLATPLAHKAREVSRPPTYAQGYLEPYLTYHIRYLAIDCEAKHNTTYFADCCHPLLATQSLKKDRKAYCVPSAAESSSAAAEVATAVPITGEGASPVTSPTVASSTSVNVTPSPIPSSAATSSSPPAPSPSATPSSSWPTFADIIGNPFIGGIATFFWQNGVAGACGTVHADTDFVVALQTETYANGAHCGKQILLSDEATGKQTVATVADECPTCDDSNCIDLSHSLFDIFAPDAQGEFNVKWGFLE